MVSHFRILEGFWVKKNFRQTVQIGKITRLKIQVNVLTKDVTCYEKYRLKVKFKTDLNVKKILWKICVKIWVKLKISGAGSASEERYFGT